MRRGILDYLHVVEHMQSWMTKIKVSTSINGLLSLIIDDTHFVQGKLRVRIQGSFSSMMWRWKQRWQHTQ